MSTLFHKLYYTTCDSNHHGTTVDITGSRSMMILFHFLSNSHMLPLYHGLVQYQDGHMGLFHLQVVGTSMCSAVCCQMQS